MEKNLAIKGHATRGKEVIEILEMLGGKNKYLYCGESESYFFFIQYGIIGCDKVRYVDDHTIYTLEEFLEKFPYKIGDKVKNARINDLIGRITNVRWDYNENQIIYLVEWNDATKSTLTYFARGLQPYKGETMDRKYNIEEYLKVWEETEKGLEVVVNDRFELQENNGKFYIIKKQPQYPKTYEECAEILLERASVRNDIGYKGDLLVNLQRLLICRDAYWLTYNNWKPTHKSGCDNTIYTIHRFNEEVIKGATSHRHSLLEFPTEEMRDKFYENFKTLIFACKELI